MIYPYSNYILIKKTEQQKLSSGLILNESFNSGIVIAVGSDCHLEIQKGDQVFFDSSKAVSIYHKNELLLFIAQEYIFGKVVEENYE